MTPTQKAAMGQALDALEKITPLGKEEFGWYTDKCRGEDAQRPGGMTPAEKQRAYRARAKRQHAKVKP